MQIKSSNGSFATNDTDILEECNSFYSRRFASKKPTVTSCSDNLFSGQEHPLLNDNDKQNCEGLLTEKECLEALICCLNKSHQKGKLALCDKLCDLLCDI